MSFVQPGKHCLFCAALLASVFGGLSRLGAQVNSITLPRSVQQDQFRSQWVGQQVDQSPSGAGFSSLGGLGALVGSQQTPDQVQREALRLLSFIPLLVLVGRRPRGASLEAVLTLRRYKAAVLLLQPS